MTTVYNSLTPAALERILLENRSYLGLNNNAYMFPKNKVGALNPDGTVTLADCTNPAKQNIAGLAYDDILSGESGYFVQSETLTDAIAGLGASAGDVIYLGVVAGSLTKTAPSGPSEAIIKIGVAEANPITGLITDLRVEFAAISTGGGGGVSPGDVQDIVDVNRDLDAKNNTGSTIPALRVIAWDDAGTIVLADASDVTKCDIVGMSVSSIPDATFGKVRTENVIENACLGLSAVAGQEVFLDATAGGLLTLTAPTNPAHAVIKVGVAVPKSGTIGPADDLLIEIERIALP